MPKNTKPSHSTKAHAKSAKVDNNVKAVAVSKLHDMLIALLAKGGYITVDYVKVNGDARHQSGFIKPTDEALGNKLSFHLTGDFNDARNWRGCRTDCIVRIAARLPGNKNVWDCTVRTTKEAQSNAAKAFERRELKRIAKENRKQQMHTPTAKGDLF